eukprot:5904281-Amphidinium_carterae.1
MRSTPGTLVRSNSNTTARSHLHNCQQFTYSLLVVMPRWGLGHDVSLWHSQCDLLFSKTGPADRKCYP